MMPAAKVVLTSYKAAREFISRGRLPYSSSDPRICRPVRSWGLLRESDNDTLTLSIRAHDDILRFRPDNTIEFIMPERTLSSCAMTIGDPFYKVCRVTFTNRGTHKYSVISKTKEVQYYEGLVMDCETREFTNAMAEVVNEEKRKAYLKAIKDYRYMLAVRAKMGMYDNAWRDPAIYRADLPYMVKTILTKDLTEMQYPPIVISLFLFHGGRHKSKDVVTGFDKIIKAEDRTLRRAYGVYEHRAADSSGTGVAAP